MLQHSPISIFKWLTDKDMEELDVMVVPVYIYIYIYIYFIKRNVSFLCISEYPRDFIKCNISLLCVSEYLQELRDLYKDYPLAPECLQIENILSNYQDHLLQDEGFIKPPPKLVLNLCNKLNYIIHYFNLKLNLKLGLPLSTVHHVLSFNQ